MLTCDHGLCISSSLAAAGRGSRGGVSGFEDAAAAGVRATECVPEQNQDADRLSARQGEEGAGAEGLSAEGSAGAEGKRGLCPGLLRNSFAHYPIMQQKVIDVSQTAVEQAENKPAQF